MMHFAYSLKYDLLADIVQAAGEIREEDGGKRRKKCKEYFLKLARASMELKLATVKFYLTHFVLLL
jgi:hypothetical protein